MQHNSANAMPQPTPDSYLNLLLTSLAAGGQLEMDFDYGFELLNRGLQDIALLQLGTPFSELGISQRRQNCMPQVIALSENSGTGYDVVQGARIRNEERTPKNSIALLRVRGMMQNEVGMSARGIYDFADDLRAAYANRNVSAVIIEVDSGGGQMAAGTLARQVVEERNKPVIAYAYTAGSAAYNMISPADEIIAAQRSSRLGGIGTFITIDLKMLQDYKARYLDIYADGSKKKNQPIRAALDGDFSYLKEMVTQMTEDFHADIAQARPLTGDRMDITETLSGLMFKAEEAKARGLADGIGNYNYMLSRVEAWIKKDKP